MIGCFGGKKFNTLIKLVTNKNSEYDTLQTSVVQYSLHNSASVIIIGTNDFYKRQKYCL